MIFARVVWLQTWKIHFYKWSLSIGNSIVSSAITDKHARVSFLKTAKNSASPQDERYLQSLLFKKLTSACFPVIARETILLLVNDMLRNISI